MTWGATLIVAQAEDWGVSVNHSSTSMNYGILLQGFGGIFAVPFIEAYGRWDFHSLLIMAQELGH